MHYAKAVSPLVTAITVVALATEALSATDEETKEARRRHAASQFLFQRVVTSVEGKTWIENHMALRKGIGLVYRQKFETEDDRKLVLSVGGPMIRKKRFGLMFEVRF